MTDLTPPNPYLRWIQFGFDCVSFLWSLAFLAVRWAALTLAFVGLGVVIVVRDTPVADAALLGAFLMNNLSPALNIAGMVALLFMGLGMAVTASGAPRLPPRWDAWCSRQSSRFEAWVEASWAKLPKRTRTIIGTAFVLLAIGAVALIIWHAPEPSNIPVLPIPGAPQ